MGTFFMNGVSIKNFITESGFDWKCFDSKRNLNENGLHEWGNFSERPFQKRFIAQDNI